MYKEHFFKTVTLSTVPRLNIFFYNEMNFDVMNSSGICSQYGVLNNLQSWQNNRKIRYDKSDQHLMILGAVLFFSERNISY